MASWFRIQRCPCSGAGSIPGPGSSACRGHVQAFTSLAALLFPEGAWLLMGHDCRSPSWRSSRSEGLAAGPEAHLEATFMLQLGLGEGLRVEPPHIPHAWRPWHQPFLAPPLPCQRRGSGPTRHGPSAGFAGDPQAVLQVIRRYVRVFFGCKECAEHFEEMAEESMDSVRTADQAVLWLWRKHNVVNSRLAGERSHARRPRWRGGDCTCSSLTHCPPRARLPAREAHRPVTCREQGSFHGDPGRGAAGLGFLASSLALGLLGCVETEASLSTHQVPESIWQRKGGSVITCQ